MSISIGEVKGILVLDDRFTQPWKAAQQQLAAAGKGIEQMGASMSAAGRAMAPLSLAIGAVGIGAVKMATDLNASLANVSALLTNLSGAKLDGVIGSMKTKVQDLAVSMGKSTTDISGGLYEVISSLGLTNDTFGQLEISAKAGAAGLATTQEAFNFLSSVTKTYGDTSEAAFKKAADLGFQAVNFGQTTFPELAAAIGGVAPIAKVAGVSMEEMFAVIATATGVTGNTSEVVTQMAASINALLSPSKDMALAFEAIGVKSGEALIQQRGFAGSLQAVAAFATATETPMLDLLGRKEAFILTSSLAGSQALKFSANLGEMGKAATASGGVITAAFEKQTQGVNAAGFAWNQFKSELVVTMQHLGDAVIPILSRSAEAMKPLWQGVKDAVDWFAKLPQPVQTAGVALAALVIAAGPALIALGSLISLAGLTATGLGTMAAASVALGNSLPVLTARVWLMDAAGGALMLTLKALSLAAGVLGAAIAGWAIGTWVADLKLFGDAAMSVGESFEFGATKLFNWARGIEASDADIESAILSHRVLKEETTKLADATAVATVETTRAAAATAAAVPAARNLGAELAKTQVAVLALTEAQKASIDAGLAMGISATDIADVLKLSEPVVTMYAAAVDAAAAQIKKMGEEAAEAGKKQAEAAAKQAEALTELQALSRPWEQTLASVSARVVQQAQEYLTLGASLETVKTALGLTDAQMVAIQRSLNAATVATGGLANGLQALHVAAAGVVPAVTDMIRTLSGELITLEERMRRQQMGGQFEVKPLTESQIAQSGGREGLQRELEGIEAYWQQFPGAAPGGSGATGVIDAKGRQRNLEKQRRYLALKATLEGAGAGPGTPSAPDAMSPDALSPAVMSASVMAPAATVAAGGVSVTNVFHVNGTGEQVARQASTLIMRDLKKIRRFPAA